MKDNKNKDGVFVPVDAEMNDSSDCLPPPKTEYDQREGKFRRNNVKNLVKGNYGNNQSS
jgi:hypothetical protein